MEARDSKRLGVRMHAGIGPLAGIVLMMTLFLLTACGRCAETEYVYVDGGKEIVYIYPDSAPDSLPDAALDADAGGDAPECVTDDDCAKFNSACLVFRCQAGSCFAHERDEDGDGHSLCGGKNAPGAYDCDDSDPSVYPGVVEVCV